MELTDGLTELVGDIYDAALEPDRWPETLGKIVRFVDGQASGLVSRDQLSQSANVHYHVGVAPEYIEAYKEQMDPLACLPFMGVGEIVSTVDVLPHDQYRASRFYREWAKPQGLVDAANVLLEKSPTCFAYLSVIRGEQQGMVDAEMRRRMKLIVPHVRRAVLIGKVVCLKRVESAAFADVLDGLSAGMFMVGADGRIVHANAAGHTILSTGKILRAVGGRLVAADQRADQTLRDVLLAAGEGDCALGHKGIAMPLNADGPDRYVAHVLPLTAGQRQCAGRTYAAVAAVFVRETKMEPVKRADVIGESYRLTPTELRVLMSLLECGGVPDVADALGIAETTVKTHLTRVFSKTGVRRQADLVKLVAGFASGLAS